MFEIEKGIPVPPRVYRGRVSKYPFANMEVGESFLVEATPAKAASLATAAGRRRPGWKFISRKVDETHARVWRVA